MINKTEIEYKKMLKQYKFYHRWSVAATREQYNDLLVAFLNCKFKLTPKNIKIIFNTLDEFDCLSRFNKKFTLKVKTNKKLYGGYRYISKKHELLLNPLKRYKESAFKASSLLNTKYHEDFHLQVSDTILKIDASDDVNIAKYFDYVLFLDNYYYDNYIKIEELFARIYSVNRCCEVFKNNADKVEITKDHLLPVLSSVLECYRALYIFEHFDYETMSKLNSFSDDSFFDDNTTADFEGKKVSPRLFPMTKIIGFIKFFINKIIEENKLEDADKIDYEKLKEELSPMMNEFKTNVSWMMKNLVSEKIQTVYDVDLAFCILDVLRGKDFKEDLDEVIFKDQDNENE